MTRIDEHGKARSTDPRTYTRRRVIAGTGIAAVLAGFGMKGISFAQDAATPQAAGGSGTPGAATPVPDYTTLPAIPPELAKYENDWPAPHANLSNTRAAKKSSIDSSTVANLEVAWTFPIKAVSGYGGTTCLPIIAGNRVYIQDQTSNVFSIDQGTGEQIWAKNYDTPTEGPNGLALGYGQLYGSTGDGRHVFALDVETGKEVWNVELSGNAREGIDMAPQVYGGLVYISTVPGNSQEFYDGGARGVLYALDATSGQVIWQFYTVDNDLWGEPTVNSGGGSWYPPAIDSKGNTYWDVANPAPFQVNEIDGTPITLGSTFDDGLYSDCLVKLSPRGEMQWFYAANRHDIFDHDLQQSPVLVTVENDGQPYTVAVSSGKLGRVIAIEVERGLSVWTSDVGKHTPWNNAQWVPPGQTVTVEPGVLGGVEGPIAYADGTVFVPVLNSPANYTDQGLDTSSLDFSSATGQMTALNIFDGTVKWNADMAAGNVSGTVVANDVVFAGGLDGIVRAYKTDDGSVLWSYDTGVGLNAPFAVAGDMLVVPAAGLKLVPQDYKPEVTPVAVGDSGPAIIGFKLKS
jgi:outer membrane protein assembly factor BamB